MLNCCLTFDMFLHLKTSERPARPSLYWRWCRCSEYFIDKFLLPLPDFSVPSLGFSSLLLSRCLLCLDSLTLGVVRLFASFIGKPFAGVLFSDRRVADIAGELGAGLQLRQEDLLGATA